MQPPSLWAIVILGATTEPDPAHPDQLRRVVYQRTDPRSGNIRTHNGYGLQRRRHVIPRDPKTPIQRALRARLADAVAAWHALTPEQRQQWRSTVTPSRATPYMQWVKYWCETHPADPTPWQHPAATITMAPHLAILANPTTPNLTPTDAATINLARWA